MDKPILIIIEGCDNTGKSTLAEELKKRILHETRKTVEIAHLGKPTEEEQKDLMQWHLDTLESVDTDIIIMDRFHLSNICYGSIMDHSVLTTDELIKLEAHLLDKYYVGIIYCFQDPVTLEAEWDDPMIKKEQILQILTSYQYLLRCSILPIVVKSKTLPLDLHTILHLCTVGSIMASKEDS